MLCPPGMCTNVWSTIHSADFNLLDWISDGWLANSQQVSICQRPPVIPNQQVVPTSCIIALFQMFNYVQLMIINSKWANPWQVRIVGETCTYGCTQIWTQLGTHSRCRSEYFLCKKGLLRADHGFSARTTADVSCIFKDLTKDGNTHGFSFSFHYPQICGWPPI